MQLYKYLLLITLAMPPRIVIALTQDNAMKGVLSSAKSIFFQRGIVPLLQNLKE